MSAMSIREDVNIFVITLMEAITVLVMMDTPFKMIPNALVGSCILQMRNSQLG